MAKERPAIGLFEAMETPALIDRYARGVECLDRRVLGLSEGQLDTFFRPEAGVGRWSCRVLLGHVADAEIVYSHRMRRTVAEDRPVLAVWDENAFIDGGLYDPAMPAAGSVALIHTVRLWTAEWLRTLDERAMDRRALHPERGEESVRRMLALSAWHLEHHAWYLARKVGKLLGGE